MSQPDPTQPQPEHGRRGRLDTATREKVQSLGGLTFIPPTLREALEMPFEPVDIRDYGTTHDGKKQLTSIDPNAVIRRMNDCFSGAWSFEIVGEPRVYFEALQVVAHVRISYTTETDGLRLHTIFKDAIGNAVIKTNQQDPNNPPPPTPFYNLGWDIKSAVTDGLKKAASLFGVGFYMWERDGSKETPVQQAVQPNNLGPGNVPPGHPIMTNENTVVMPNPAQPFQIEKICKFFDGLNYPREQWMQWFGLNYLDQMTVTLANGILSGQHPVMADFQQKTGNFINPGLKASLVQ